VLSRPYFRKPVTARVVLPSPDFPHEKSNLRILLIHIINGLCINARTVVLFYIKYSWFESKMSVNQSGPSLIIIRPLFVMNKSGVLCPRQIGSSK